MRTAAIIIYFIGYASLSIAQEESFSGSEETAKFPGGFEAFYKYFSEKVVYPISARKHGAEGRLFLSFAVTASGYIDPSSVKLELGFDPDCNAEAIRVVKAMKQKWSPALRGDNPVRQKFTLPFVFILSSSAGLWPVILDIINPMQGVVASKPDQAPGWEKRKNWSIYKDIRMTSAGGEVSPGDTVKVWGWAPSLYLIKYGTSLGYLSAKALVPTDEVKALSAKIQRETMHYEKELEKRDSVRKATVRKKWEPAMSLTSLDFYDDKKPNITQVGSDLLQIHELDSPKIIFPITGSARKIIRPRAFFRISSSIDTVQVGDCAIVELAFLVADDNRARIQFFNLGEQVSKILNKVLYIKECFVVSNKIDNIEGEPRKILGSDFTEYPIFKAAYCPTKPEDIIFKPISLSMAMIKPAPSMDVDEMKEFKTKPLTIHVHKPYFRNDLSKNDPALVGRFIIADSISAKPIEQGKIVQYNVTVTGKGLSFPLRPPVIAGKEVDGILLADESEDTIVQNNYYSRKKFIYSLRFNTPGEYDLSKYVNLKVLDPESNRITTIGSQAKAIVLRNDSTPDKLFPSPYFKKDLIVAVDISQSMMISDRLPTRLAVATLGATDFLDIRKKCDIGIIVFGGHAVPLDVDDNLCYSSSLLSVKMNKVPSGTAIGEAIWLAINSLTDSQGFKKLVIIGDGDNTAGAIGPDATIPIAVRNKLKIYAIGVGSTGLVPFIGPDGKSGMVDNTFSDTDFKKITAATGGKYYEAKDRAAVTRILQEIFSNP